ncbi:MAG: hypothetical protein JKY93_01115 [Gammaproteobacteria bacterium]|nr:hypothetical protein [Gammaproteobacteria bacterium]
MLQHLDKIEAVFKELLVDNTGAAGNVLINALDVTDPTDDDTKYIFVYFTDDIPVNHDEGSTEYHLSAKYVFECLVADKNADTILDEARILGHQVQQILLNNPDAGNNYFDLRYTGSNLVKDAGRSIPLVGYKLNFELDYLSGLL